MPIREKYRCVACTADVVYGIGSKGPFDTYDEAYAKGVEMLIAQTDAPFNKWQGFHVDKYYVLEEE